MGYFARKVIKESLRKLDQQNDPKKRQRLEEKLWNADCFILYDKEDQPKQQPIEEDADTEDYNAEDDNTEDNEATGATEPEVIKQKETGSWPTWAEIVKRHGKADQLQNKNPEPAGDPAPEKGEVNE